MEEEGLSNLTKPPGEETRSEVVCSVSDVIIKSVPSIISDLI